MRSARLVAVTVSLLLYGCGSPHVDRRVVATVVSPDGTQLARITRHGGIGYVEVRPVHGGKTKTLYSSNDACCAVSGGLPGVVWATDRLLVFTDDANLKTVDVKTGRVTRIADFSDFAVSPDGRWATGSAWGGRHQPRSIHLVSIDGTECRVVPRPTNADDGDAYFTGPTTIRFFRGNWKVEQAKGGGLGRWLTASISDLPRHACNR
jgi:hypothetical protein